MAARRKVALIYQYDENWIGGTYYIQNLILALNIVPDEKKPHLVILCDQDKQYQQLLAITGYPYIESRNIWKKLNIVSKIINKAAKIVTGQPLINLYHVSNDLDLVVLQGGLEGAFKKDQKKLYWIPDFQERYLPEFFTKEDLVYRHNYQQRVVKAAEYIVFSSQVAKTDFDKFYPDHTLSPFVMQFAVTHRLPQNADQNQLVAKYALPTDYYICSNQFWRHKNHTTVLEAIAILKQRGEEVFVAFTGKENDTRYPKYFGELMATAEKLNILDNIKFLGFISREDQLGLMKQSVAVIQPSLFEGWSTVIEDAKALNIPIICSDLDVHKEQLESYESKRFFLVSDGPNDLANVISSYREPVRSFYNYQEDIKNYGSSLTGIIENILQ